MRLINTDTLRIEEYYGDEIPEYVILSHTWGKEEVTYGDIMTKAAKNKVGFAKIKGCCSQASLDGYKYAWIDTCCIDKTSSAELSEAINSMFQWYKSSQICYAYLEDVADASKMSIKKSRWFTRGWTLQELLAPPIVEFYNKHWDNFGTKSSLEDLIEDVTGIRKKILRGADIQKCPVAERMSWASFRCTTRVEDEAYCLMGIFDCNMPLLYGEGKRAFIRLQEEILKRSEDHTIFAWRGEMPEIPYGETTGILATSPADFVDGEDVKCSELVQVPLSKVKETVGHLQHSSGPEISDIAAPVLGSRGIYFGVLTHEMDNSRYWTAALLCRPAGYKGLVCLKLEKLSDGKFARIMGSIPFTCPVDDLRPWVPKNIYAKSWAPPGVRPSLVGHLGAVFQVTTTSYGRSHLVVAQTWTSFGKQTLPLFFGSSQSGVVGVLLVMYQPSTYVVIACGLYEKRPWCKIDTELYLSDIGKGAEALLKETFEKFQAAKEYSSNCDRVSQTLQSEDVLHASTRRQASKETGQYKLSLILRRGQ